MEVHEEEASTRGHLDMANVRNEIIMQERFAQGKGKGQGIEARPQRC